MDSIRLLFMNAWREPCAITMQLAVFRLSHETFSLPAVTKRTRKALLSSDWNNTEALMSWCWRGFVVSNNAYLVI